MLNQLYNNEDEIVEKEELTLVGDFIETIRTLRAGVDDESISGELLKFLKCRGKERRHGSTLSLAISTPIRKPMGLSSSPGNSEIRRRPKDTSFTIHHYLDLTDDVLNDSVNGLNITETQKDYRRESLTLKSTPIKAPITSSPRSTFSSPMGNNNERFQSLFKSFPNKRRKLKDEK